LRQQVEQLQKQNQSLQEQLRQQRDMMDALQRKVSALEASQQRGEQAHALREGSTSSDSSVGPLKFGNVVLSGEGGLAFFHQGSAGRFSHSDFRVDEAKLFLEAKLWQEVYFFTELNIAQREEIDEYMTVGEIYVDFENVSSLWNVDRLLNVRAGRVDVPFGEEYLTRDAIDNPLISHSVSDVWGVDEGVELYGSLGRWQYVFAVQNGSRPKLRDYDSDKSVAGRIGFDPAKWLHLSVSAMRTGNLAVRGDELSELWFGNGFFRALGPTNTTSTFYANLVEGDVQFRWNRGHLNAAGGYAYFDDNDAAADNHRDLYYYYIEGMQKLTDRFYAASRFSHLLAPGGYPLVGMGEFGNFFFRKMTEDLWRLSLGVGYRWNRNLLLKGEYSFNYGSLFGGGRRNHENMVALEIAYGF
jgi:hypothetical protein